MFHLILTVPIRPTALRILESIFTINFEFIYYKTYRKQAAVCSECGEHILPGPGETQAVRIRALGRNFHTHCFKCKVLKYKKTNEVTKDIITHFQECGKQLDSNISGSECYPMENEPYCLPCNRNKC